MYHSTVHIFQLKIGRSMRVTKRNHNFLPVSFLTFFTYPKAVVPLYLLKPKAVCKTFSPISDQYVQNILELS